ncbi:hypothetical protein ACSNOH_02440 [Streptomyces sp. URMC 127]|uniref:hypothetical protein n=1 Tax=Streptomyces sp. URMC 127 TaxID=3423402 RepID=UPI003F1A3CB4
MSLLSSLSASDPAVGQWLAATGRSTAALQELVQRRPGCGLSRALVVLADSEALDDATLRSELLLAHRDATRAGAGAREQSLVYAIYLFTHRHYRATADHLIVHFAQFPADVFAGSMLSAFALAGPLDYREHGHTLAEQQYALAGAESWPWASWLAGARAEQGRPDDAWALAEHALALNPRSGPAVHARAHAEHEHGTGPACAAYIDTWLAADPHATQRRHLQWHAALQSIAAGDFADARRRADTELHHGDVGMRSATNWRLLLAGQAPARTADLDHIHRLLAEPGGWAEVFHTFQLALGLAVAADTDALQALARRAASDARPDYADVLAPVAQALAHITAGRAGPAVDLLAALGDRSERIGGVRVEREIIQDTLARALIDAGQPQRAAHLLHHRTTARRNHTYENLLLAPQDPTARPAGRRRVRPDGVMPAQPRVTAPNTNTA